MSKHIIDSARFRSGSIKLVQYARIASTERPQPQSKALQQQQQRADPQVRARRFLDIDRRKGL